MKRGIIVSRKESFRVKFILIVTFFLILVSWTLCVYAENELDIDSHFSIVDEEGKSIFSTALTLSIGDVFIDEDNRSYEVMRLDEHTAYARFTGIVDLVPKESSLQKIFSYISAFWGRRSEQPIVIYHTHSDESYVPTSGIDSKYWGDVYQVGKMLKNELERQGYNVIHALENHNPHDGAAYERSRRTVAKYLKDNPIAFIDVHRDAVSREVYSTVVNNQPVTKIALIIGRQNQNKESNMQFAKSLKNETDTNHPGLIKGILLANGNYNQDVGPRMILLEVGAHTNTLEEAERAATFFSSIIPSVVYGTTSTGQRGIKREGSNAARTALWVIVLGVIGVGFYIAINSGGLKGLISKDMTSSLGAWFRRRKKNSNEKEK